jgi:hypothetical protein
VPDVVVDAMVDATVAAAGGLEMAWVATTGAMMAAATAPTASRQVVRRLVRREPVVLLVERLVLIRIDVVFLCGTGLDARDDAVKTSQPRTSLTPPLIESALLVAKTLIESALSDVGQP